MLETETLIDVRKWLNLSQEAMGRMVGVSFATINRWERGHSAPVGPSLELYRALDVVRRKRIKPEKITGGAPVPPGILFARIYALAYGGSEK